MTARKAALELAIEGGPVLTGKINPRLVRLSLSEKREDDADEMDLVLQNADGLLEIPETGVTLSLALGWESGGDVPVGLVDKGKFIVDEVGQEGPPDRITIKARSADMTGALRKLRTQSWTDIALGDLLDEIAGRHGRAARVEAGLAVARIDAIEQEGKSDLAFVRDLGRRFDAIATWKNGLLLFLPIGGSSTASGAALDTLALTKRQGWRWTYRQADRENFDGAEAQWQDQGAARRRTVQVGGDNRRRLKNVYASESEARQAAEAAASRAARKPFRFTYDLAIAEPALQPDMKVALQGWGDKIDGTPWLIESVRTEMGARGLHQSIEMESA